MKIPALDLGKFKSVACLYDTDTREAQYVKIKTAPMVIHQLIPACGTTAPGSYLGS